MPIYATNNGNIGDYNTVSGVVSDVSGSHVIVSGDYSTHQGGTTSHHDPSGYESISGDYLVTSGVISDYPVLSGDFSGHVDDYDTLHQEHDDLVTDFGNVSGDYITTSGAVSDYPVLSGDYAAGGGGVTGVTELSGGAWKVYYSNSTSNIVELSLGSSGLVLQSAGPAAAPDWQQKAGAGGDDLGSHVATKILDMGTFRVTGMGDPTDAQDATTKVWTEALTWTKSDITDLDTSGYDNTSGDFSTLSGDFSTLTGVVADYPTTSGDYAETSGNLETHKGSSSAHHIVTAINDTPTDTESTTGVSSNWAYDHLQLPSVHHIVTAINDTPTDGESTTGASSNWAFDHNALYTTLSGVTIAVSGDYVETSGDYSSSSGDLSDYKVLSGDYAAGGGGVTGISELDAQAWTVFYNNASDITGLALGASGLVLSSVGVDQIPVWSTKVAGGGDNLGSHEATQMLDMNTLKITGLGDPADDQDAATKKFVDDHDWTKGDITDLDTTGYEQASGAISEVSGDYVLTSGNISDYGIVSGAYSTHQGNNNAHHIVTAINDTPTDTETTTGVSSNWAYDHLQLPNIHHIVTAINDTPTDTETTTGVSSNWAYDHLQEYNSTSGAIADYPTTSGDYVNTAADYVITSGTVVDYAVVSGDVATALQNVSEDGSPELGADLDLAGYNISVAPSYGSDHQHEGLVVSITTDAGAYGEALYMKSNGAYAQAKADAAGTMPCSAIWVASGKVLLIGTIRDDTYDFTIGGYVYVSEATAGLFTTTAPGTATNLVQKVGIALSADSMYFNPGGFRTVTVA